MIWGSGLSLVIAQAYVICSRPFFPVEEEIEVGLVDFFQAFRALEYRSLVVANFYRPINLPLQNQMAAPNLGLNIVLVVCHF